MKVSSFHRYPWDISPSGYLWETPGGPGAGAGGSTSGSPSGGSPTSTAPPSSASSGPGSSTQAGNTGTITAPPSPADQGPVPYSRFEEVNTKLKSLSWAEQHDPERVAQATQLYDWFDRDPEGAYEYLTSTLKRSGILKEPAPAPGGNGNGSKGNFLQDSTGRPLPDVEVKETGARFYSAEQAERLVDWKMAQFEERIKPIEAAHSSSQTQTEARQAIAEAERTWPHFTDHAPAIFKELQKDRRLSLEGAYRRVVVPQIKKMEREAVMTELRTKGQAGTQNPGAPAPPHTGDLSKVPLKELFKREMARRGMGPG